MDASSWRSFAILPAAGASRRMGRHKLRLPWDGKTVIEHVLAVWRASRVDHVVLVVRPDDAKVAALGRAFGVEVVVPPERPPDMKASVALGLAHVTSRHRPREEDAWLLAPADMPRLTSPVIDRLLAAYDPGQPQVLIPVAAGRRGHPVLLPWRRAAEVPQLPADSGINALVRDGPFAEIEVQDTGIHEDLDTPEDYQRLK